MSNHDRVLGLAVPIIGEAIVVHPSWICAVPVTCQCPAKPVFIVSLNMATACPSCRKAYTIGSLQFDIKSGAGRVEVIQVLAPQTQVAS